MKYMILSSDSSVRTYITAKTQKQARLRFMSNYPDLTAKFFYFAIFDENGDYIREFRGAKIKSKGKRNKVISSEVNPVANKENHVREFRVKKSKGNKAIAINSDAKSQPCRTSIENDISDFRRKRKGIKKTYSSPIEPTDELTVNEKLELGKKIIDRTISKDEIMMLYNSY